MILPIGYWVAQLIGWKVNEKAENISTEKALVSKFVGHNHFNNLNILSKF